MRHMKFSIVTVEKEHKFNPLVNKDEKLIKEGTIIYTDGGGISALFKYTETIRGLSKEVTIPVNSKELSVIGCKYCYRIDILKVTNSEIIKYIPEDIITEHTFNSFKFKPNSTVEAVIKDDKAYVITKQERRKKKTY